MKKRLGIIDADLLDNGTRHPNLACMKISAYYKENGWDVELLETYENLDDYDLVSISRVFSFTNIPNSIYKRGICKDPLHPELSLKKNIVIGGTGFYYDKAPDLKCEIEHHMPDYHLYDNFIEKRISFLVSEYETRLKQDIEKGKKVLKEGETLESLIDKKRASTRTKYCDYLDFSIGFVTRGCFRKCSFCVNKKYDHVFKASPVNEFLDESRPCIYLWDDNFMASPDFNSILDELIATNKPFQFRQGLDMRLMTDSKAEKLSNVRYHGDYIFAFDHIEDKYLISKKLEIWRNHCSKSTKLYVLTGYDSQDEKDIENTFERIKILMEFGCLPYIMRYEDYKKSKFRTMYIELARWCNQPAFIKKQSFRQYCENNEKYHKEHAPNAKGTCSCYQTMIDFENEFPEIAAKYYDIRMEEINRFPSTMSSKSNKSKPSRTRKVK